MIRKITERIKAINLSRDTIRRIKLILVIIDKIVRALAFIALIPLAMSLLMSSVMSSGMPNTNAFLPFALFIASAALILLIFYSIIVSVKEFSFKKSTIIRLPSYVITFLMLYLVGLGKLIKMSLSILKHLI